jgi:GTPase SAR1 family protein
VEQCNKLFKRSILFEVRFMAFININPPAREVFFKIVYYGPGLSGKTSNLQYIYHRMQPEERGQMVSSTTEAGRSLSFSFMSRSVGELLGYKPRFGLYCTPGPVFDDSARQMLLRDVDGIIFVADSQAERMEANDESLDLLRYSLEARGLSLDQVPLVLQYNKRDLPSAASIEELDALLRVRAWERVEAIATQGVGVFDTLKAIAKLSIEARRRGSWK